MNEDSKSRDCETCKTRDACLLKQTLDFFASNKALEDELKAKAIDSLAELCASLEKAFPLARLASSLIATTAIVSLEMGFYIGYQYQSVSDFMRVKEEPL